jgi:hypothetical protein
MASREDMNSKSPKYERNGAIRRKGEKRNKPSRTNRHQRMAYTEDRYYARMAKPLKQAQEEHLWKEKGQTMNVRRTQDKVVKIPRQTSGGATKKTRDKGRTKTHRRIHITQTTKRKERTKNDSR